LICHQSSALAEEGELFMKRDPDQELWQRAKQGEEGAYEQLRHEHRSLVRGEIRKRLRHISDDDTDDIDQEVWIAVWLSLPKFRAEATFDTWLAGITKHAVFHWVRHHQVVEQALALLSMDMRPRSSGRNNSAATRISDCLDLSQALEALIASDREVILLRYFWELSDGQVALRLRLPLGTVKSRIRRGLLNLRLAFQFEKSAFGWQKGSARAC
jgi:RNA polymerase sigma-70 factor (ECF subfamily)